MKKIKITEKMLCIPPHLSTTWENIKSLRVEYDPVRQEEALVISLSDGYRVKIFHLEEQTVEAIFSAHLRALEQRSDSSKQQPLYGLFNQLDDPFLQLLQIAQLEGQPKIHGDHNNLNFPMQHTPGQAHLPPLPSEILRKIGQVARSMRPDDVRAIPKPEPHCNCLHCQIVRTIHREWSNLAEQKENEEVSADDLKFRFWDIAKQGEQLYLVSNPLDASEHYSVFLGEPLGCTCGQKNCEHIRAVLSS